MVSQVAPRSFAKRVAQRLAITFGYTLLLVGMLAAVVTVVVLAFLVMARATGESIGLEGWAIGAGGALASLVLIRLGLRIARGRRRLVLFLRRFGFKDASEALTYAVGTAMGRNWRLVTLDDGDTGAVGSSSLSRWGWGVGRWLLLVLFLAALGLALQLLFGGGDDQAVSSIASDSDQNSLEELVSALVTGIVVAVIGAIVLVLALLFTFFLVGILLVSTVFVWRVNSAVQRAEDTKALTVTESEAIAGLVDRVAAIAQGIQAPRFVVMNVSHELWKQVVRELSAVAPIVLIDVSAPSENLLWEVNMLKSEGQAQIVLVGRQDRAEALAEGTGPASVAQLRELLDGELILAYKDLDDNRSMRSFAKSLGAMLDAKS